MNQDLMLVCRNGHVITDRLNARPDLHMKRCDVCAADTLDRCETCGHPLAGANAVPGFEPVASRPAPATCTTCGSAFPWTKPAPTSDDPFNRLERLLRRIPLVLREASRRERAPFNVRDDRDLDALIRALLPIEFDDVRPFVRTPEYAGNRGGCSVPSERIVVISHLVDREIDEGGLSERMTKDVNKYSDGMLMCFVYDPEGRLPNHARLEANWSQATNVRCVVA